jgi:hypothetical protein
VPSRSGRAPNGASARLTRSRRGRSRQGLARFLPCTERSFGVLFCRPVQHPLRGSLPQTRAPGAVVSSARGSTPLATAHAPLGVRGGIRLNGYCWRLMMLWTSKISG